jgi:DNA-binding PadR family transcriptional regulator
MGPGTIYGSIQRMEEAGLVRETTAPADDDGDSRRRYYALTEGGRKALETESERVARLAELVRDKKLIPGGGASR